MSICFSQEAPHTLDDIVKTAIDDAETTSRYELDCTEKKDAPDPDGVVNSHITCCGFNGKPGMCLTKHCWQKGNNLPVCGGWSRK